MLEQDSGRSSCREFFRAAGPRLCHPPRVSCNQHADIQSRCKYCGLDQNTIMSAVNNQRKAEILAKKAKLAELKRQRELRQKEFSQSRASTGDASEVCTDTTSYRPL
jgi:hypothetical protein